MTIEQVGQQPEVEDTDKVRALSDEIARCDAEAEPLRRAWQQTQHVASPELKSVVDEVKSVLQQLLQATQSTTQSVRQTQAELGQQIEHSVLKQQAAEAYRRR